MPISRPVRRSSATTAAVASAIWSGRLEPLVSQRVEVLGAGAERRLQAGERVAGVVAVAVEEVLGVVDHPLALRRRRSRPSRRSSPGSPRGETRVTFSRCRPQVLPTRVTIGAKALDQRAQAWVVLGGEVAPPGHPEGADARVLQRQLGERARRARLPSGWSSGSRPRSSARRGCRGPRPRVPSRPPRGTSPRPACRRAGSCRRALPGPSGCLSSRKIGETGHGVPALRGAAPRQPLGGCGNSPDSLEDDGASGADLTRLVNRRRRLDEVEPLAVLLGAPVEGVLEFAPARGG